MRHIWFLVKLSFFLIADAFRWLVAFGRLILVSGRKSEVIEKHKRLVDWLWGTPSEFPDGARQVTRIPDQKIPPVQSTFHAHSMA
jgi:hypothetical protein